MAHMQPEIHHGQWVMVQTEWGDESLPFGLVTDGMEEIDQITKWLESNEDGIPADLFEGSICLEGETIFDISVETMWGARMSAPGYLDCTEWAFFDTEVEAIAHLKEEQNEEG